jgi:hypothetical protein
LVGAINSRKADVYKALDVLLRENAITIEEKGKSHIVKLAPKSEGITIHDY